MGFFKCHSIILHVISYVLLHSALYVAYDMLCCMMHCVLAYFNLTLYSAFVVLCLCPVHYAWLQTALGDGTKKTRRRAGREHTT